MELFFTFLGVVLVGGIVLAIIKRLWFYFAWRVLGFKPQILVEEQVQRTINECALAAIEADTITASILGIEMTDDQRSQHLAQVEGYTRTVIERYVHNVMTHA